MEKIILNTDILNVYGHHYLKTLFDFPDSYGENLDGLRDLLAEKNKFTLIINNEEVANEFSLKVIKVIKDVNDEYQNIDIIYENGY